MGSGASRKLQPRIPQEQWLSHDGEDDKNKDTTYQGNIEWDVSHTDTLTRYTMNYPEQAEDFQTMFQKMQVLRNTMNSRSTSSDRYSDPVSVVFLGLGNICYYIHTSIRTEASTKMRVVDFMVEIDAAELLQRFAQS